MAQFDIYKNNGQNKKQIPYILDIQNDILSNINTRVVVPLGLNKPYNENINPKFIINSEELTMMTTKIATIPLNSLGDKVGSLEDKRSEILNALDFLITGF